MDMTYNDILNMSPEDLFDYVDEKRTDIMLAITNGEDAEKASQLLNALANTYSLLSSLSSYAKIKKRQIARNGKGEEYEDLIDKQSTIDTALKAIDIQYKAVSKEISLYMSEVNAFKNV